MSILRSLPSLACLALAACGQPASQPATPTTAKSADAKPTESTPATPSGTAEASPKPAAPTATAPVVPGAVTDDLAASAGAAAAAAGKPAGALPTALAPLQLDANSSGNVLRPEVNLKIGELARLLGGIKDKASALLAKPKLETLIAEFGNLKAGGKLEVPPNVFTAIDSLSRHFEIGPVLGNTLDALRAALQ